MIGNAAGVVSLLIYLWQYLLETNIYHSGNLFLIERQTCNYSSKHTIVSTLLSSFLHGFNYSVGIFAMQPHLGHYKIFITPIYNIFHGALPFYESFVVTLLHVKPSNFKSLIEKITVYLLAIGGFFTGLISILKSFAEIFNLFFN